MAKPDQASEGDPGKSADDEERDLAAGAGPRLVTAEARREPEAPEADDGWLPV